MSDERWPQHENAYRLEPLLVDDSLHSTNNITHGEGIDDAVDLNKHFDIAKLCADGQMKELITKTPEVELIQSNDFDGNGDATYQRPEDMLMQSIDVDNEDAIQRAIKDQDAWDGAVARDPYHVLRRSTFENVEKFPEFQKATDDRAKFLNPDLYTIPGEEERLAARALVRPSPPIRSVQKRVEPDVELEGMFGLAHHYEIRMGHSPRAFTPEEMGYDPLSSELTPMQDQQEALRYLDTAQLIFPIQPLKSSFSIRAASPLTDSTDDYKLDDEEFYALVDNCDFRSDTSGGRLLRSSSAPDTAMEMDIIVHDSPDGVAVLKPKKADSSSEDTIGLRYAPGVQDDPRSSHTDVHTAFEREAEAADSASLADALACSPCPSSFPSAVNLNSSQGRGIDTSVHNTAMTGSNLSTQLIQTTPERIQVSQSAAVNLSSVPVDSSSDYEGSMDLDNSDDEDLSTSTLPAKMLDVARSSAVPALAPVLPINPSGACFAVVGCPPTPTITLPAKPLRASKPLKSTYKKEEDPTRPVKTSFNKVEQRSQPYTPKVNHTLKGPTDGANWSMLNEYQASRSQSAVPYDAYRSPGDQKFED